MNAAGTTRDFLESRWRLVKLRELGAEEGAFADGPFGSNLKTEHYSPSGARVVRLQNIGKGTFLDEDKAFISLDHFTKLQRHAVAPGDIVVAALGDGARPAGRACLVPEEFGAGIVKADCFRLRFSTSIIHHPYAVHAMNSEQFLRQVSERMRGATRPRMTLSILKECVIPIPPVAEQKRIAAMLNEQISSAQKAIDVARAQKQALSDLVVALLRDSMAGGTQRMPLAECLTETKKGVGPSWSSYPVLGATRAGLALAKEPVGKQPERYKLVDKGTIFYNPMRILLGSIATVDSGDSPGITSPDYVVFRCNPDRLHHRWLYHWLRSPFGERFIKGLTRGAVRERLLFKRLAVASIEVPSIEAQQKVADRLPAIRDTLVKLDEQIELAGKLPSAYLRRAFAWKPDE